MRDYEFYYTQDGSIGLYSYADNDVYHSKFGALSEAWDKFIIPSGLERIINHKEEINVLDICYGIGYNTKSLMSYVLDFNKKNLKHEKKIKNFSSKKILSTNNIDSIGDNNIKEPDEVLLVPIESNNNIISLFYIDCLEYNEELVKISPLLKTLITPEEIFSKIIPDKFSAGFGYPFIKKLFTKILSHFLPDNTSKIKNLLNLKFSNNYLKINNKYKIHEYVNLILVEELIKKYGKEYIDISLEKVIKDEKKKHFFDKFLLKYAYSKQNKRINYTNRSGLLAFLHNIYYAYLSNRDTNFAFNFAKKLFKVNYYIDDARKTILNLNKQYDLVFLDAFTFSKAPELWSVEFIAHIYNLMSEQGILMTYSNSALVRNTFIINNFYVGKIYDEKTNKFIGTIASKDKSLIKYPLSNEELGLCTTKAGIPYRDPSLMTEKCIILNNREAEFQSSSLISSSQYMKTLKHKGVYNG